MKNKGLFEGRGQPDKYQDDLPIKILMQPDEFRRFAPGVERAVAELTARPFFVTDSLEKGPWGSCVCIGEDAVRSMLGRKIPLASVRRGLGWHKVGSIVRPVRWVFRIGAGQVNYFMKRAIREDLECILNDTNIPCWFDAHYELVETADDTAAALEEMSSSKWVAYDCETAGLMFSDKFEVSTLAATCSDGMRTFVWGRKALSDSKAVRLLLDWLANPMYKKVGHNIKFDMLAPKTAWGVQVAGVWSDTRLKRKLLCADALAGLDTCSELVGMGGYKQEFGQALDAAKKSIRLERTRTKDGQMSLMGAFEPSVMRWAKERRDLDTATFAYSLVPDEIREVYCARDAFTTALLEKHLEAELDKSPGQAHVWREVLAEATEALERVETWGILTDLEAMRNFEKTVLEKRAEVAEELAAQGLENPASTMQVSDFLFVKLGLTPLKKSEKTGAPSADKATLEALKKEHEAVGLLLEFRRLSKLADAYGEKMALHIRDDGRIHPELKLDGTRTGRLSCRNPGLHQIPRAQSDEGKLIKDCFVAPPGHKLVQLDYSQLELRVAAMLSEDEVMINMFKSGEDFHTSTAKLVAPVMWGIKPEDVQKEHRTAAKVFNFGLLYGMTVNGLASRLHCDPDEAAKLKASILGKWTRLSGWLDAQMKLANNEGYTQTWWAGKPARRREVWQIANNTKLDRMRGRNASINTPVQGTASDFCLASISQIVGKMRTGAMPGRVVLTVHDSIILEVPEEEVESAAKQARDIMMSWDSKGVPLKVDCEAGTRWGSLTPLDV